ncbi:MAG: hypothetical protein EDM82_12700 [Cyanobacteria bacterium CYA]|nr:MAG: hypothetical protein EDM82_12700 [Cyanobacteria bacterium CYA]
MLDRGHLSEQERFKLATIIDEAVKADSEGRLLFGNVWKQQVATGLHQADDAVIQTVRAVHLVGPARELGIDPSVAVDDASTEIVNSAMGLPSGRTSLPVEPAEFLRLLPKSIIAPETLRAIPFEDVINMQEIGKSLGYFTILERLRRRPEVSQEYLDYLSILRRYMDEIKRYMRTSMKAHVERRGEVGVTVEMWDWQDQLIKKFESAAGPTDVMSIWALQIATAVPIAAGITDLGLVLFGAHPGRPLILSAEIGIASPIAGGLAGFLGYRKGGRLKTKLKEALGGTYTAEGSA